MAKAKTRKVKQFVSIFHRDDFIAEGNFVSISGRVTAREKQFKPLLLV